MARRHRHEEHVDHERWAIPYADLLTLLLAFFVVMYAVSSVNEGKYRVLSDALVAAFRNPPRSLAPIQVGEITRSPFESSDAPQSTASPLDIELILSSEKPGEDLVQLRQPEFDIAAMADQVEAAMAPLIDEDLIAVRRDRDWVEVEIKTSLLFPSASAVPTPESLPLLKELAGILAPLPNRIHVEGFTDNLPINTSVYPSNWELSAARAASVVRLFAEYGVDPERMAAIGFGEHRPVADNATEAGRAKNRRVAIVVLAGDGGGASDAPEVLREDLQQEAAGAPGGGG